MISSPISNSFTVPSRRDIFSPTRSFLSSPQKQEIQRISCNGMLRRRDLAVKGISTVLCSSLLTEDKPAQGLERLPFKKEGYSFWNWKGNKIHYVEQGTGGPPVILIHGFGASAYHWRYNIPELAKSHKVYALDLLGFGWSDKALVEYDAMIWRDQVTDFLKEIVKEPAVLVGNSLGGFTALIAASELPSDQIQGVVLINSAGQFGDQRKQNQEKDGEDPPLVKYIVQPLKNIFQRIFLGFLFWQAKQPSRIESVLKSVYINSSNVDDYLVDSIMKPAGDPNAGEVYYRLMSRFMSNQSKYTLNSVLQKLTCPLLLLWGDLDPWVGPAKAIRIKEFYPNTSIVNLQAGHCPHDEVPELANEALENWLSSLPQLNSKTQKV
ncbi:Hydrolase, alpha/beta fold family protein [Zostera marina]|uniref:Hydrolase, alpha/beta fold family protein n=1 Tax=Zostera marina TaxID=29655 RepID=A0A0K9PM39_ZOSMR|nr:Hydrolase, alpha/beta fold family protein [Zostera marina]